LEGATLRGAYLEGAIATGSTRWPDGFDWQGVGVILMDEYSTPVPSGLKGADDAASVTPESRGPLVTGGDVAAGGGVRPDA
jgi:hypothetical protein